MRWLKRFIFLLFLLFVLLVSVGVFINWKYADDLERYVLGSLHEVIETDFSINENARFSLWKDFPLVAVELRDVYIQDSFKEDTLLAAKKAYAQLDVLKILRNDFTIEGVRLTDGLLRLRHKENGDWNFRVWKETPKQESKTGTDFSIEILVLENIYLDYDDRQIDLNVQFLSEKSKIKGRFTDENQRFGLSLKGFMPSLNTVGKDRIINLPMTIAGVLNLNSKDKVYTVEMGNAILAENEMVWDAEWRKIEGGTDMKLKVHAGNIEPDVLLPHVWPQIPQPIINLKLKGKSDLIVTMNGPFTKTSGPELEATVKMRNGQLVFQQTDVKNINLEGRMYMKDVKRSKAVELTFNRFSLETPKGKVSGSGTLRDLGNPYLAISTKGVSRIEEILKVANVKEDISGEGNVSWNIDFKGPLGKDFHTSNEEFKQMEWSGSVAISEASARFTEGIPPLEKLSGNVTMDGQQTKIADCSGKIGHLVFNGQMEINALRQILTEPSHPVDISGKVELTELDVEKLPAEWKFASETSASSAERDMSLNVDVSLGKLLYKDFTATDLSFNLRLANEQLTASNLNLNALGGSIDGNLMFQPIQSGYAFDFGGNLQNIDISRTLKEWNNFGQQSISHKNLKGFTSATIELSTQLNNDYQIVKDKLHVESDLEIIGGELVEFEPLLAMSKFISVDELNHVKFDTLRNQLTIEDSKLIIPRMTISSSILNVDVFGEHGFDQEMDYHVNLLLNDLLRRKAKRKKTFDGHEIIDKRGKTRLFLWIRGRPGNIKVGYDKQEVRKKIKQDLKKEGQAIKQLFQEEFGGAEPTEDETETIQFKLEEDITAKPKDKQIAETEEEKPKKKRGFFSTEPEKEETEGGFEIEFDP